MRLYAAPLQGITTWIYRRRHQRTFGGAERYYTPFFSPPAEHLMTPRERRDLCPEHNAGVCVVPQVMTRRAEDFLWAAGTLAEMGYREVNLNLGCPSGTVMAKGKGAALLSDPRVLDQFFDAVFSAGPPVAVSVKTRLGVREEAEFAALLEVYRRYPLAELIVHTRVQRDLYRLPTRPEAFAAALEGKFWPVCYNGDLITPADCAAAAERYPAASALMLGRGLIADPALARKVRGGAPASKAELEGFLAGLFQDYLDSYGTPGPAVQRMKEHWFYLIHLFDGSERLGGRMRRAAHPAEYETLAAEIFRTLPLRRDAAPPPF